VTSGEVRVEPSDLVGKAGELGTEPADALALPSPPCALSFVMNAAAVIQMNGSTLKSFMASGNAEAVRLSETLSAVAVAYSTVDTRAAQSVGSFGEVPIEPVMPNPTLSPTSPAVPASPPWQTYDGEAYADPKTAAAQIHSGSSSYMRDYADAALAFSDSLRTQAQNYSLDGINWEGTGAEAAGDSLMRHQAWLTQMADNYAAVAAQANQLADAHDRWAPQHPTVEQIEAAEREVQAALASGDRLEWKVAQEKYHELFLKSEEVREGYKNDVGGVTPKTPEPPPPGAARMEPIARNGDPRQPGQPGEQAPGGPQSPKGGPGGQPVGAGQPMGDTAPMSQGAGQQPAQSGGAPAGGAPSGGVAPSGGGGAPGGSPSGLPGGGPQKDIPKLPTDPSLRPAAASGGGAGAGGGGGGGMPSTPLSPPVSAETVAPTPIVGAAPGPSTAAAANTAGTMMGGMGGMAPMYAAGMGGQNQEKKRNPAVAQDEELYTEDRPWTEAVIGNRRRRETQEGKESK
jgi:uncharacterized membrane protein YgcG